MQHASRHFAIECGKVKALLLVKADDRLDPPVAHRAKAVVEDHFHVFGDVVI